MKFGFFHATAAVALLAAASMPAAAANMADQTFVMKATQGGMAEVKTAQLALKQSSNPAVDRFANRMITDHGMANSRLAAIVSRKGMTAPMSVGSMNRMQMDQLATLHGRAFDRAYLRQQMQAHQMTADVFRSEIANGQDPALVRFARATLPTVLAHIAMDKRDMSMMMGGMSSSM